MRGLRHLPLLLALAAALGVLAGCARRVPPVERATREGVLLVGVDADISSLDPQLATGLAEQNVLLALFEGLVDLDPATLAPRPAQAERWEVSGDGLAYTFFLRPGLRWSDGSPLTAADFAASYRRLLSPRLGANYAALLDAVVNAPEFRTGRTGDFGSVGIEAVDDRTLRFRLREPSPTFLEILALPALAPVPVAAIARSGAPDDRTNPWTRRDRFVGNGPFRLADFRPGQVLEAARNRHFRDPAAVRLNGVRLFMVENLEAEERMFRAGQLHVTSSLPVARVAAHRRDGSRALREVPFLGTDFLRCNLARPGANDPRFRRALSLAVDRAAIARQVLQGTKQPARGLVPPQVPGFATPAPLPCDPEEARRLLAAAGFPGGRGAPAVEILFNSSEQHRAVAEAVQEMWRRELGLTVTLRNAENKVVQEARKTGDYQFARSSWVADFLDGSAFLQNFTAQDGNNLTGWADPAYDELLRAAARTADPAARLALLHQAEERLLAAAPIIPLYHYTNFYLVHPAVRGWPENPLDRRPLTSVYLEP